MENLDFENYIQSSRIRSARSRKRMQREDYNKKLIRLHKEERMLWEQMRNLGWRLLTPPIQRGFVRYFTLRPDVARTKQAAFFEKILTKINTRQWSSRKDFKKKRKNLVRKSMLCASRNYVIWKKENSLERNLLKKRDFIFMKP